MLGMGVNDCYSTVTNANVASVNWNSTTNH